MSETILLGALLLTLCFIGFGIGVFFFGKTAHREACGTVPDAAHEDCPSQKAGLCPVEDLSGTMKLAQKAKISYNRH